MIAIVCIVFVNGISITNTNRVFSTKYYDSAIKAFEKEYSPSASGGYTVEIKEELYIYDIDENNTLLFAETTNKEILVCQLHKKNNKYFYLGNYSILNIQNLNSNNNSYNYKYNLYNGKGKNVSSINIEIVVAEKLVENIELLFEYELDSLTYKVGILNNQ